MKCVYVFTNSKDCFSQFYTKKKKKREVEEEEKKNAADDLTTINCIKLDIKLEPSKTEIY